MLTAAATPKAPDPFFFFAPSLLTIRRLAYVAADIQTALISPDIWSERRINNPECSRACTSVLILI